MMRRAGLLLLLLLPQLAVTQEPDARSQAEADFDGWVTACRERFAAIDARVEAAGVRDAGFHRIPGFPYLRSDRLIAAYRDSVDTFERMGDWTAQLRENDSLGRDVELSNLGLPRQERAQVLSDLRLCSVWLTNVELARPETFRRLIDAVVVPPEFSAATDAVSIEPSPSKGRAVLAPPQRWRPQLTVDAGEAPQDFASVHRDTLGRVGLYTSAWRALVEKHAPEWIIDTGGAHDRPGAMSFDGARPQVRTDQPVVYYLPGFARVHGRTLVQLSYVIWFSARPAQRPGDPEAGAVDGLIWRVTLDDAGQPLVYESVSVSGAHHQWYPVQSLPLRASMQGRVRVASERAPAQPVVRVTSGTHAVSGVLARQADQPAGTYALLPYEELLTLPKAGGGTRSLFGPDGVVPGSERAHGASSWPRGFPKPGAMRQWGHHLVSFSSGLHLDDPALIERTFELPMRAQQTASVTATPSAALLPLHRAEEY